jgi:hypothetical protein
MLGGDDQMGVELGGRLVALAFRRRRFRKWVNMAFGQTVKVAFSFLGRCPRLR